MNIESSIRLLTLKIYEGRKASTFRGNGVLLKCGLNESTVSISGVEVKIKNDTIVPITIPFSEMTMEQANMLGAILTENESTLFTKGKHPINKDIIIFETKRKDMEFGFELDMEHCSINSAYQLKNVFEAYMFLAYNGFPVSKHFGQQWG